jgi:HD-GYP domain-containing protein (c-di-GMP phosphodiesterase class II)
MKREIPVEQLQFGMYIHELDRPWTETPFMFQGFELKTQDELDVLKKHCKKVFVDTEKSKDLPETSRAPLQPEGKQGSVLDSITRKVEYVELETLQEELPRAREAHKRAEVVLKDAFTAIHTGKRLDAERVQDAVTSITDSVARNPDAMLLLTKLRERGEQAVGRAVGVSVYMVTFGRFLHLPPDQLETLGMLGLLQDVGKVRVPEALLNKRERLSEAEIKICRGHVDHSIAILRETPGLPGELPVLAALHHERFDGSGYPNGLKGNEIGLFGSIAALVDCFDAMTRPRPYAEVIAPSNALNMLYGWRDRMFSGPLVEQFIQCIGIYPVGAIVELNSGEIGIVIAQNLARRLLPRVMVVLDANRNPLRPQRILDLSKEPKHKPGESYRIKRTLEKDSVPIDPADFFI